MARNSVQVKSEKEEHAAAVESAVDFGRTAEEEFRPECDENASLIGCSPSSLHLSLFASLGRLSDISFYLGGEPKNLYGASL